MRRHEISDEHWEQIKSPLPGQPGQPGVTAKDNRLSVNSVLWIAKTGAPWRDLPERSGPWGSVRKRFDRWAKTGVWKRVFDVLQDPDLKWMIRDSTVVRAHQHAAGRKGGQSDEALGRSRGGFSTKIPILVDALGDPVEFPLTAGQEADVTQAEALIEGHPAEALIADEGHDSDAVVEAMERQGAEAVIPPKRDRKVPRDMTSTCTKSGRESRGSSACSSSTGGWRRGTRRRAGTS
jgi:transposase